MGKVNKKICSTVINQIPWRKFRAPWILRGWTNISHLMTILMSREWEGKANDVQRGREEKNFD